MATKVASGAILFLLFAGSAAGYWPTGQYVIVCPDSFVEAVQPLADWKTSKGVPGRIVPLSETGSEPEDVRDFLRDAWQNWPDPPGYVLLVCSPNQLTGHGQENDSYFGDMEGNYLMEIPVGRLPAWNRHECSTMVAKCFAYERYPEQADTLWYLKGTTIVNEENPGNPDLYYRPDSRFARALWRDAGYVLAESLSNLWGDSARQAIAAVHDGRTFLTYRGLAAGWWQGEFHGFHPFDWTNGHRMPVIVSATCATVTLAEGEQMLGDMCMRYGSPESLGGTVAFFGTTMLGSHISHFRSAVFRGFFDAIFNLGMNCLGTATLRGRYWVDSLYHEQEYYEEWTLLGDPEMRVWTSVPRSVDVSHDSFVGLGLQELEVSVSTGGAPVAGALVCVMLDSSVYVRDTTGLSGVARLSVEPLHPGTLSIVVTGRNLRPYEGTCVVRSLGGPFVVYLRHDLNDSPPGGNGDRNANPGETITIPVWVANYGDSAAPYVTGVLSTDDTLATVLDSVREFGTIAPHDSALTGPDGFRFRVEFGCPDGHELVFRLRCQDTSGAAWWSGVRIPVGSFELEYLRYLVRDSSGNNNGRLDPRETASLIVMLRNSGHGTADEVSAKLRSFDSRLTVNDSLGMYFSIPPGDSGTNPTDPFRVTAAFVLPETEIPCSLYLSAPGYAETLGFILEVGMVDSIAPIPDIPGRKYWAYDDIDTAYVEHPEFDWVELRDVGTRLELGDNQTVTIPLPEGFGSFSYYDRRYDEVSICSNGWLAPGRMTGRWWVNRCLPDPALTQLLAVNWDDLHPGFGSGVWYHWDSAGHRFVVEWDSVHYRMPFDSFETFQVLIYDSTQSASDGNSEFVYQYLTGNWLRSSTIGTQDPTCLIAINVVYDNQWDRAAARVRPGRAIKFTTDVPVPGVAEPETPGRVPGLECCEPVFPNPVGRFIMLRGVHPAFLFDITGRKVADLQPGENDVRHLAPGVYFVSQACSVKHQASSVRKVVIQR